jgi:hypothetical protein
MRRDDICIYMSPVNRARLDLPLRFHLHQQPLRSDRYVYAARIRFVRSDLAYWSTR